ncbi:sugar transferase, partial [candidate division KSB1 bacterium]|nr:sugar transferase [candidate division KSB1 bacterium]
DDDFRIPYWGHVLRKLWLDELPMLYNLILGDLKIVGVRPLSLSKFQMYPQEMQELRMKAKPGLIPPFYADLPDSFAGHMASEKQYIESYLKKPISTDLAYLYRALYQIFVKKARSK